MGVHDEDGHVEVGLPPQRTERPNDAARRAADDIGRSVLVQSNPAAKIVGWIVCILIAIAFGWLVVHRINGNTATPTPSPTPSHFAPPNAN